MIQDSKIQSFRGAKVVIKMSLQYKKFVVENQIIVCYLRNFVQKTLSVSEKAVFLQPQNEQVL
jgi:hypothetical protein